MATVRKVFWRQAAALFLILLLLVGLPLYVSTDSFMTRLCRTARERKWESAPAIVYGCAEYYQWTSRNRRAVETFEQFLEAWPDHRRAPEALLFGAGAIQATMVEMQQGEPDTPERAARIEAAREKAIVWLETMAARYPSHTWAGRASRSAEVMRKGD